MNFVNNYFYHIKFKVLKKDLLNDIDINNSNIKTNPLHILKSFYVSDLFFH